MYEQNTAAAIADAAPYNPDSEIVGMIAARRPNSPAASSQAPQFAFLQNFDFKTQFTAAKAELRAIHLVPLPQSLPKRGI